MKYAENTVVADHEEKARQHLLKAADLDRTADNEIDTTAKARLRTAAQGHRTEAIDQIEMAKIAAGNL
jgi:hypothetical protein